MDKNECEDKYSESETEEHLNGKRDLFEWIRKQNGVTHAVLEGWILETKQRPDIMFDYDGKKYVIEYQCSPISSEYVERHDLYEAAGIIDIWILGTEKYLQKNMRKKFIQNYAYGFYSYQNKYLFQIKNSNVFSNIKLPIVRRSVGYDLFYGLSLEDFVFDNQIYHQYFRDTDEILKKKSQRQLLQNKLSKYKFPKRHNKYLKLQYEKDLENIKKYLNLLSNKNWDFHIDYSNSLIVEPCVVCDRYVNDFYNYKKENYRKLDLENLKDENYDNFKRCTKDIEFLKTLLLPLMIHNKKTLLDYQNENIRFMEVRDN